MKIVETWRLFFQFCFSTSEGTGSAIRGGNKHEEKDTAIACIDVDSKCARSLWKSYQKDDSKASAKGSSTSNKQVLNLTETAEIPTMDTTLSTDAASSNIMNNTMEGLYRRERR